MRGTLNISHSASAETDDNETHSLTHAATFAVNYVSESDHNVTTLADTFPLDAVNNGSIAAILLVNLGDDNALVSFRNSVFLHMVIPPGRFVEVHRFSTDMKAAFAGFAIAAENTSTTVRAIVAWTA